MTSPVRSRAFTVAAALAVSLFAPGAAPNPEPISSGGPLAMRRLSPDQYRASIGDIFGEDIVVNGQFESELRIEGLAAIGATRVTLSPSGFAYSAELARKIAAQVMDKDHRGTLVPCAPSDPRKPDAACATRFVEKYGLLLFRRPLDAAEVSSRVRFSVEAGRKLGGFYEGLEYTLIAMLVSPEFLFIVERAEDDQLDAFSKAQRLSFLLWNSTPDAALLEAARTGALDRSDGLAREADRLLASPRFEQGVRAFFSDMFNLDAFSALTKDSEIYPLFTRNVVQSSHEQILRNLVDIVQSDADYRDILSSRQTYMNRDLGFIYDMPVRAETGWEKVDFPESSGRAGILSSVGFLALHAHPGRSSATLRGAAIRETLLCQAIPPPPGNVDFTLLQNTGNPNLRTARARLSAHVAMPACAGCHKLMDPIGLPLETFDGAGRTRRFENGERIDTSGAFAGKAFDGAGQLGPILRDEPQVPKCLVTRLFGYATGRVPARGERRWLAYMQQAFGTDDYRLRAFLRRLVLNANFYRVDTRPALGEAATPDAPASAPLTSRSTT